MTVEVLVNSLLSFEAGLQEERGAKKVQVKLSLGAQLKIFRSEEAVTKRSGWRMSIQRKDFKLHTMYLSTKTSLW